MSSETSDERGPDFSKGILLADFGDRSLLRGHVGEDAVVLAKSGNQYFAVGANCTHYGGPLAEGLIEGETVRCPWHHACFSLRSGEAINAPAFDPIPCWQVEQEGERLFVRAPLKTSPRRDREPAGGFPHRVVIVGGGAAGFACAEMLRRRGFGGNITMLSDDSSAPVDRPNLSKDYLTGNAPEEWMPLRPESFYGDQKIDLQLNTSVARIDVAERSVITAEGKQYPFDRLLIATGAEPIHLPIPGHEQKHVFTLRSMSDARAIIAKAKEARSAVVLGSGFIGLETAASLRTRGLDVVVVSLDRHPLERVLGTELGDYIRHLHEDEGVVFRMESSIKEIGPATVTLSDQSILPADLVILGIGVRPRLALAEAAGLATDKGILVDERMETSVPGIFAAGDVARWMDSRNGERYRVEHWVVAERQGQVVAENMLGTVQLYRDTPFFWSAHYETMIRYAGHAQPWDRAVVDGNIMDQDCRVSYQKAGRTVAVATIGRDRQTLEYAAAEADRN